MTIKVHRDDTDNIDLKQSTEEFVRENVFFNTNSMVLFLRIKILLFYNFL